MHKKSFLHFLLLAVIVVAMAGCSLDGKRHYLKKFGEFIAEVEEKGLKYSDQDWQNADQQYRIYSEVYWEDYNEDFSAEELQQVNDCIVRYRKCRLAAEWERIMNSEI